MKKLMWCVISQRFSDKKNNSISLEELTICKSKEEAIRLAMNEWEHLSIYDKDYSKIIAGTCNIDEEEQGYYCDDRGNCDADIYDIILELEA